MPLKDHPDNAAEHEKAEYDNRENEIGCIMFHRLSPGGLGTGTKIGIMLSSQ